MDKLTQLWATAVWTASHEIHLPDVGEIEWRRTVERETWRMLLQGSFNMSIKR